MAEEIIEEFGSELESIKLIKGDGGIFEVEVNGIGVFSKKAEHRHAAPGEVVASIRNLLQGDGVRSAGGGQRPAVSS